MSKRSIKHIYSRSSVTQIESDSCCLPTVSALSNKLTKHALITWDQQAAQVSKGRVARHAEK